MTQVSTSLGRLEGMADDGLGIFRGVPYATASRFSPPEPPSAWTGTRDATRHGMIAPQAPSRLRIAMGESSPRPMGEDCLNLTVWTPAEPGGRRPVLVWLHGGAWVTGAGSLDWYDGARLAREGGIVVVGVNHRLGALGYLRHQAVSPGNLGTMDQVAALAWVRKHIEAFGGDPDRVTVGGQSAGASSIGRMMLDPAARALFRRAILMSGGFGRDPLDAAAAEAIGDAFLRQLGPTPEEAAGRLRTMPAEAIVEAQSALARSRARFGETSPPFMPSLDAPMTEPALLDAIAASATGKDLLLGATHDEAHAFFAADATLEHADPAAVEAHFEKLDPARPLAWYAARRPGAPLAELMGDAGTATTFLEPTMRLAAAASRYTSVHAYLFNWAAPGNRFRSCHCIDLPFLFGTFPAWQDAPMLAGGDPAQMAALSATMRRSWARFVRDGDPGQPHLPWPAYTPERPATMVLGETCGVSGAA